MNRVYLLFLVGLLVGVAGTLMAVKIGTEPAPLRDATPGAPDLAAANEALRSELDTVRRERDEAVDDLRVARMTIADLQRKAPAPVAAVPVETGPVPAPAAAGPPTKEELIAGVRKFGDALQGIILGNGGEEEREKLREFIRRAGPEGVQSLIDEFHSDSLGYGPRLVLAHALAQSGDPAALKALEDVMADPDAGMMDYRLASHGLAFTDEASVAPILLEAARNHPDLGARANSAFGLARRGDAEGVKLYAAATDAAFEAGDSAAIQYLSGFALLGKAAAPAMRERLGTYKDKQARLVLIELLKDQKDLDSIPDLRALLADPSADKDLRDAAEKALRELETE